MNAKVDSLHHLALVHHTAVRRLIERNPRREEKKIKNGSCRSADLHISNVYRNHTKREGNVLKQKWENVGRWRNLDEFQKFSRKTFLSSFHLTKHAKWAVIIGKDCLNAYQLDIYSTRPSQINYSWIHSAKIDSITSDLVYFLLRCPVRALRHFINFQFQIVGLFIYLFFARASAFLSWCGYWIYVFSREQT